VGNTQHACRCPSLHPHVCVAMHTVMCCALWCEVDSPGRGFTRTVQTQAQGYLYPGHGSAHQWAKRITKRHSGYFQPTHPLYLWVPTPPIMQLIILLGGGVEDFAYSFGEVPVCTPSEQRPLYSRYCVAIDPKGRACSWGQYVYIAPKCWGRPPLWSSGQRSRIRFLALPDFLRSSGSGTGSTQPREDK
jgi:hypothetical protein